MEYTILLNILQWITPGIEKKLKCGICLSRRRIMYIYVHILCTLLLSGSTSCILSKQRRHKIVCALIENTVKVREGETAHIDLILSFLLDFILRLKRVEVHNVFISTKPKLLGLYANVEKRHPSVYIANGRLVSKDFEERETKRLLYLNKIIQKFVQRRKCYKHICLSKESDILNGQQVISLLCVFASSASTQVITIEICVCSNQIQDASPVQSDSCLTTLHSMETQIRTTVIRSYTHTKDKEIADEREKVLQTDTKVFMQKTGDQCLDSLLQRQILSKTITEINQKSFFSSKSENKGMHLWEINVYQSLQMYPVLQYSLEQAFTSRGEGGGVITNPEVFFSNNLARLSSYHNFQSMRAPSAIKLSNAGFFATGNSNETACFHCGCRYCWLCDNEDPIQIHAEISPECEFIQEIYANEGRERKMGSCVTNGTLCSEEILSRQHLTGGSLIVYGNEHLSRDTNTAKDEDGSLNDRSTSNCANISMANSTEDFQLGNSCYQNGSASNGHIKPNTNVTSISCAVNSLSLDNTPSTTLSVPLKASSTSASCKPTGKVPLNANSDQQKKERGFATNGAISAPGSRKQTHEDFIHPLFPQYQSLVVRMSSFAKWPRHVTTQTPKQMALAGFFYKGYGDAAVCFWCGVCVVSWEDEDEPCIEHVKWQPLCPFTIQTRGQDFVDLILEEQRRSLKGNRCIDDYNVAEQTLTTNGANRVEKYSKLTEMGFEQEDIDNAVRIMSRRKGNPSDDDILEQLLNNDETQGGTTETTLATAVSVQRDQVPPYATSTFNYASYGNDSEDDDHLRRVERLMCKICMTQEVNITFLPCGHLVCCTECSGMVWKCPVCRARVENRVKSYIS